MKNVKVGFIWMFSVFASSCSINGNFKGLHSYYNQTVRQKPDFFVNSDTIDNLCDSDLSNRIIITNGIKVKECLRYLPTSLIYMWSPNCSSGYCYSLAAIQQKCKEKNIQLIVVAEYYDISKMNLKYNLDKCIFSIDTKYYRTNLTAMYREMFLYDLTGENNPYLRFIQFENGILSRTFENVDSI